MVQNWKVRWFVLKSDRLLYYKYEGGKRDSCHRGTIPLSVCKITCPYLDYENRPVSDVLCYIFTSYNIQYSAVLESAVKEFKNKITAYFNIANARSVGYFHCLQTDSRLLRSGLSVV